MLEHVRVEYSVEATINTGNFQNVRPGYRLSADLPAGMHPQDARAKLKKLADAWLEEDIEAIHKDMRE